MRVRFRSCGTLGYGPTMWVKSRKGTDSKACQMIDCQLCCQQRQYQGRGTKRTIFLLVEQGGPIGKVLVTGMSTAIITRSYRRIVHRGVFISRELILLRSYGSQVGLNKPMERKRRSIDQSEHWKGKCVYTQELGVYPSQGEAEQDIHDMTTSSKAFR